LSTKRYGKSKTTKGGRKAKSGKTIGKTITFRVGKVTKKKKKKKKSTVPTIKLTKKDLKF